MGLRFRKSINFGPLRINLSKSGVGFSLGVKGFRVSRSAKGKHNATISLPGTGLSYTQNLDNLGEDLGELKDKAAELLGGKKEEETEQEAEKSTKSKSTKSSTTKKSAKSSTTKKTAKSSSTKSSTAKKTTKSSSSKKKTEKSE